MALCPAPRSHRPGLSTGAVLLLLIATLVHVLACAHGAAPAPAGQPDTFVSAQAACPQQPRYTHSASDGPSAPTPGSQSHCWALDEPAQAARDLSAHQHPDPDPETLPLATSLAPPARAYSPADEPPSSGASSSASARARLGVWRT